MNSPLKAGRREWIGLAVLALPALLVSMDTTVMYLAVPALSAALKPNSVELLWISDSFGFLEAGFLITMGTLGDRVGRRRLLLVGGVAFAIASVIAAFAPSALLLILSRGLLGIAGATLLPSTLSIIRHLFHDERQRTVAFGIYTTCFSAGTMLGPLVGGILLGHFWWGAVFLIPVPLMLILLALGAKLLPEFREEKPAPMDLISTALLVASVLSCIYGIKQISAGGVEMLSAVFILMGLVLGGVFVSRQRTERYPLINLHLFRSLRFNVALTALLFSLFAWAGMYLFVGQYLQLVLGLDPVKAGLLTMPGAAGGLLFCMSTPVIVRWVRRGLLMAIGLLIMVVGLGLLSVIGLHGLPELIAAEVLLSGGCGVVVTIGIDMVVAAAPPENAGAAAGISETSTTLGGALGIALLGSIWTASYRSRMDFAVPPGIPAELKEAARNTLGEALSAAGQRGGPLDALLINNARMAFIQSLNFTSTICGVVISIVAGWVALRLWKLR
ncbi:MAG: MFS transporter [Bacteroidetes bacterium]|nr:MFS transporter [Bacteroidota bacterium]